MEGYRSEILLCRLCIKIRWIQDLEAQSYTFKRNMYTGNVDHFNSFEACFGPGSRLFDAPGSRSRTQIQAFDDQKFKKMNEKFFEDV
jgi:hypothetical protein